MFLATSTVWHTILWISETQFRNTTFLILSKKLTWRKKALYIKAEKYFRRYCVISVRKVHSVGSETSEVKFHYGFSILYLYVSFLGAWMVPSISGKYSALINSLRRNLEPSKGLSTKLDEWKKNTHTQWVGSISPAYRLTDDFKWSTGKAGTMKMTGCLLNIIYRYIMGTRCQSKSWWSSSEYHFPLQWSEKQKKWGLKQLLKGWKMGFNSLTNSTWLTLTA